MFEVWKVLAASATINTSIKIQQPEPLSAYLRSFDQEKVLQPDLARLRIADLRRVKGPHFSWPINNFYTTP